jgi:hypothetical protein
MGIFALAASLALVACAGKSSEGEHTSTIVRGTYGDPNPIVPACEDAGASDAGKDGC